MRFDLATGSYIDQYYPNLASWQDIDTGLQGLALPDGNMFLTTLSITQASGMGVLWKAPARR